MAEAWFSELKRHIKAFVSGATEEQLDDVFEKANFRYYREIKTPILWHSRERDAFAFRSVYRLAMRRGELGNPTRQRPVNAQHQAADDYADYDYSIAA